MNKNTLIPFIPGCITFIRNNLWRKFVFRDAEQRFVIKGHDDSFFDLCILTMNISIWIKPALITIEDAQLKFFRKFADAFAEYSYEDIAETSPSYVVLNILERLDLGPNIYVEPKGENTGVMITDIFISRLF